MSQDQLAKRIGTQRSNICRIEKGTQNLSLDLMLKIAEALDKDVSVMLEERSRSMEKVYSLRLYDETLLTFTLEERGLEGLQATILHTETAKQKLFPLDLELTNEGVVKWLERRVILKNRQFADEILKTLGLSVNNTKGIMDVCMGLSLNDSYWVVPADFDGKYADYNLYENRFSEALSLVAYTGVGGGECAIAHCAGIYGGKAALLAAYDKGCVLLHRHGIGGRSPQHGRHLRQLLRHQLRHGHPVHVRRGGPVRLQRQRLRTALSVHSVYHDRVRHHPVPGLRCGRPRDMQRLEAKARRKRILNRMTGAYSASVDSAVEEPGEAAMIRHIVFDMGQVLVNFNIGLFTDRLRLSEADAALIRREVLTTVEWVRMDRGTISDDDALSRMQARLPRHLHGTTEYLVRR